MKGGECMELNTEFYSAKQTEIGNGLKVFSKEFVSLLNDGDLPFNEEWDLSLSPWLIGVGADWFNLALPLMYAPTNSTDDVVFLKYPYFDDNGGKGFPFWFGCQSAYAGAWSNEYCWQYKNAYAVQQLSTVNFRNRMKPITSFKYNELIFYCITIVNNRAYSLIDIENEWDSIKTTGLLNGFGFFGYYRTDPNARRQDMYIGMGNLCKGRPVDDSEIPSGVGFNIPWLDYCLHPTTSGNITYHTNTTSLVRTKVDAANVQFAYDYNISSLVPVSNKWSQTFGVNDWRNNMYWSAQLQINQFTTVDEFKDYILTQCAYLGTYFTFDLTTARYADLSQAATNSNVYLGEINTKGVTTGRYMQGTEISESDQSNWVDPWQSSPWQGFDDDPTEWDETNVSAVSFGEGDPSYNSNEFLMTEHALNELCKVLNYYNALDGKRETLTPTTPATCPVYFGSTNPFEVILSVVKYPFGMIYNWLQDTYTQVVNGSFLTSTLPVANIDIPINTTGGTANTEINLNSTGEIYQIDWTTTPSTWHYSKIDIPYFDKYKNFLDFEPYCSAAVYVPFCGSIKIDPELFTGKNISVDYVVSPLDGTCKAFVRRDNLIIDAITGSIGSRIEIDSTDVGARANAIIQAENMIKAQKQNKAKTTAGFITGSIGAIATAGTAATMPIISGAISTAYNIGAIDEKINQLEFQIQTTETPFKQIQSGGGCLSQSDEYAIKLVAFRPVPLDGFTFDNWGDYAATVGFACMICDTINNVSGFTKCSTINLDGINATDSEKKQIFELFKGGVIL